MEIGLHEARQAVVVPTSREATTVHRVEDLRRKTGCGGRKTRLKNYRMIFVGRRDGRRVINNYGLSTE